MSLVVDCSVTMAWVFADEGGAFADHVLELVAGRGALVPGIWPLETANALLVAERRGRLKAGDTGRVVELLGGLPLAIDTETPARALTETLFLAREQGVSAYDAAYLELAIRSGLPLASLDARLCAAAERLGVGLVT